MISNIWLKSQILIKYALISLLLYPFSRGIFPPICFFCSAPATCLHREFSLGLQQSACFVSDMPSTGVAFSLIEPVGANAVILLLIVTAYSIWLFFSRTRIPSTQQGCRVGKVPSAGRLHFCISPRGANLHQNGCGFLSMLPLVDSYSAVAEYLWSRFYLSAKL